MPESTMDQVWMGRKMSPPPKFPMLTGGRY